MMQILNRFDKAKEIFRASHGVLRTRAAIKLGIHPSTLYALRDQGELEEISRGLYRLAHLDELSSPDLVTISQLIPKGVICLISALAFHNITLQIPHEIFVALPEDMKAPKVEFPPVRFFHMTRSYFEMGIQTQVIDGIEVRIYSPEKTVVDCFKFRNKIGIDVVAEALRLCIEKYKSKPAAFMNFARAGRVNKIMRPYFEALQ